MLLLSEHRDGLVDRLHDAPAVIAGLLSEVIGKPSRRLPARIERLIESGAWTDAALALLELEFRGASQASWRLPPLHPLAVAEGLANLGRIAPREYRGLAV
jgi:hypothetical protein